MLRVAEDGVPSEQHAAPLQSAATSIRRGLRGTSDTTATQGLGVSLRVKAGAG